MYSFFIGGLILKADSVFKEQLSSVPVAGPQPRGRPTSLSIHEVLQDLLGVSETSLRECTYAAMTTSIFPLLSFANEPVSHLTSPTVRQVLKMLTDTFHENCSVPNNIYMAYKYKSPYVSHASEMPLLSTPTPLHRIIPNDGDGLIELSQNYQSQRDPLRDAVTHRLFGIDAPELFCTSFLNVNGKTMKRHNGHLSHLAVHYYLNNFACPHGTAVICREVPRFSVTPKDFHNRNLSVFWLVWHNSPRDNELDKLDEIISTVSHLEDSVRGCLVSTNVTPRQASEEQPFLLNINALLVLSGFAHVYTK